MTETVSHAGLATGDPAEPEEHAHREPGEETRARIVAAAVDLIADHGFAATSTREISERLGFTKAALYYHFRTKEDLLAAIVGPVMSELAALVEGVAPDASAAERRRVLEGYVGIVDVHGSLMKVLANDPAIRSCQVFQTARPLHDRLETILAGSENPDLAQRTRVRAALGAITFPLLRAEADADRAEVRDVVFKSACAVLGLPPGRRSADARDRSEEGSR